MQLSCEITLIVGAFVVTLARAAQKRCIGLAWKSDRGLRTWQMYIGVSWEPGRADISFLQCAGWGYPAYQHPGVIGQFPAYDEPGTRTKGTGEGIAYRQREGVRRMFGSLSTLILPFESRETYPRKPASREGECRVMESLLGNTYYTRR
jgi:hypothetical protein